MPETQTPAIPTEQPAPDPMKPSVKPTILSIVEFGPFRVLIFNRELTIPKSPEQAEVKNEVMLSIKRTPRDQHDDPTAFPLTTLPSLAMMLEEIAKTAMTVHQLPQPSAPTAPPPKKTTKQTKKKRK